VVKVRRKRSFGIGKYKISAICCSYLPGTITCVKVPTEHGHTTQTATIAWQQINKVTGRRLPTDRKVLLQPSIWLFAFQLSLISAQRLLRNDTI
jgi:hypothetical protein